MFFDELGFRVGIIPGSPEYSHLVFIAYQYELAASIPTSILQDISFMLLEVALTNEEFGQHYKLILGTLLR